jgi:hypothetical protein
MMRSDDEGKIFDKMPSSPLARSTTWNSPVDVLGRKNGLASMRSFYAYEHSIIRLSQGGPVFGPFEPALTRLREIASKKNAYTQGTYVPRHLEHREYENASSNQLSYFLSLSLNAVLYYSHREIRLPHLR